MIDEIDLDTENGGLRLRAAINGALKSSIVGHGPITIDMIGSASKRVVGAIKTFNRSQRARRQLESGSVESRLNAIDLLGELTEGSTEQEVE
jgi:hypothetical protein